jgi:hypothetical protein
MTSLGSDHPESDIHAVLLNIPVAQTGTACPSLTGTPIAFRDRYMLVAF